MATRLSETRAYVSRWFDYNRKKMTKHKLARAKIIEQKALARAAAAGGPRPAAASLPGLALDRQSAWTTKDASISEGFLLQHFLGLPSRPSSFMIQFD